MVLDGGDYAAGGGDDDDGCGGSGAPRLFKCSFPFPQTWRSPSLPFLPRSKQFDAREHIQLARLLVCALAVARAAAAATCIRLLTLPCLPLLADQGAGNSRCAGHAPPME